MALKNLLFKFPSKMTSGLVEIKWLKLGKMSILIKNSGHVGTFIELKKSEAKSDDEMVKVNNQDPRASEGETATAWRKAVS